MYPQLILTASLALLPSLVFGGVVLRDAEDKEICESEDCHYADAEDKEICESEDCHYAANHILKWLNPEVDPCDDFYEFVCGNWQNLPVDKRANMSLGARDSLVERFIPGLIKDPTTTNGNKYFENLRNFLITCMDEDTIQSLGVTPIKQLIQKAGGWPVLDADWSGEDWDFINAETTLGGVLINVDTWFYRAENSSDVILLIYLGRSSLINRYRPDHEELAEGLKNETTKKYYDRMVDVAVALGADKGVAEKAMKEVLEFETAFIEELLHTNYSYNREPTTLKELQEEINWIDLTTLLETYLPKSFKLLPEEKMFNRKEFLIVLGKFFNQYPHETFVNYMISKAVYPLLDYVHHDLNISDPQVVYFGYGDDNKEESRFDYCTRMVSESSLGPAMAAYLGIMYTNASKVASEMTKVIIGELSKEVKEADWLDEITRKEAAKNISEIKIDVGFPPKILDLELLDKLYEGYEPDTSNYFDAMIKDKRWTMQRKFDRVHKNRSSDELERMGWKYYTIKGLSLSAHFDPRENSIDVSGPMLYFTPLFSPENPAYVNYGHIGTIVAHELIHSVDLNAAPEDFIDMEKWGSNRTEEMYEQKKQCFIDLYSSFNDSIITEKKLNGTYTQREDMADNGGIKLSLRAYRKLADQLGSPERKLPRLQQYSIEQLFMISLANVMCEIPNEEKRTEQLRYDPHSPFEFRVRGMMMNSPDFSEIFNCENKDPMNPPDKCEVW